MKDINLRLTSVTQKRLCLSSLLYDPSGYNYGFWGRGISFGHSNLGYLGFCGGGGGALCALRRLTIDFRNSE